MGPNNMYITTLVNIPLNLWPVVAIGKVPLSDAARCPGAMVAVMQWMSVSVELTMLHGTPSMSTVVLDKLWLKPTPSMVSSSLPRRWLTCGVTLCTSEAS